MENKVKVCLNLQKFAEGEVGGSTETETKTTTTTVTDPKKTADNAGQKEETPTPTVEELLAEMAQMKADMTRNKNALDKALKEKGEITKRLREKQTAEEAEAEERAVAEAERAEREAEKDRIIAQYEAKALFAEMGLQGKDLETAIQAKIDGDEKAVYSVIVKYFENKYESALKTKESEWLGNRPQVNVGVGESTTLTREQFDNMTMTQKAELYEKDRETYNKLAK